MENQDLQAKKSWWKNSSSTTNYIQEQKAKKKKKDGEKDGFRPDSRLDWKIVEAY